MKPEQLMIFFTIVFVIHMAPAHPYVWIYIGWQSVFGL